MAVSELSYLRNRSYLTTAASHLSIDVLNNGRILLVAILAVSLGMSNAQVGLFLLLYNVGASLSQPLFGWLADRFGARWLVMGGLAWTSSFYVLASVLPEWPALYALTMASLGSAAFHPGGTKIASQTSETRRTQATAFFFMAGQLGLFLGPILAGALLDGYGRQGFLALPLFAMLVVLAGWRWLVDDVRHKGADARHGPASEGSHHRAGATAGRSANAARELGLHRMLPALIIIALTYNTVSFSTQNFAPKLFAEWNYSASYLGWVAGLFMMGSAVGGVVGGSLADRIGGKPVIALSMVAAVLPVFFYIPAGDVWRFPVLLLAGFFGGMPHSIVILQAQALLPDRRALASGLALGFMFLSGALGSYVVGVVADVVGLAPTLQWLGLLMLVGAGAALFLPAGAARKVLAAAD